MTPPDRDQGKPVPLTDPLAVILYRLNAIERRLDTLMTADLYTARDESMSRRMEALEAAQDEQDRALRQLVIGVVTAVAGAAIVAGVTVL